ncbi:hypothetical protein [Aquimarina macrocephali]|uniref:hypothetical protein n=1 Tax=Aquimarina macrocephali TaxID=666563 RepID=UPI000467AD75|nr:hypothetical protein [Aquimarina macrocephali]
MDIIDNYVDHFQIDKYSCYCLLDKHTDTFSIYSEMPLRKGLCKSGSRYNEIFYVVFSIYSYCKIEDLKVKSIENKGIGSICLSYFEKYIINNYSKRIDCFFGYLVYCNTRNKEYSKIEFYEKLKRYYKKNEYLVNLNPDNIKHNNPYIIKKLKSK